MIESLLSFFGSTGFMPHGHCYLWTPGLLTLMVGSDVLIALAYFTIPALLIYFIRQRPDVPFPSVFWLFGAFIVCCGLSHLTSVITTWYPLYWFEGIVKLSTGVVSMMTAASLVPVLPQALALRSPAELAEANASLSQRNRELAAANAELDRLYHELVAAKEAQVEAESLRRLNAELEIFTAAVSHDLRAPIRGIIKASSWLEEDAADALDEDSLEILALLRSRSRRLNDMLQGLLQYYRVGIQTFAVKPVSVEELFEEIIEAVDVPQDFSVTTDAQVASVMLPYPPLVQVLGNLFSNAIHHHESWWW
ncbi:MAG: histidine kinase dimerization/phospho-acceptor domain-containing protein, partial [Myxococcota bacterium]